MPRGVRCQTSPSAAAPCLLLLRRCPGCDAAASAARDSFLSSMAAVLKAAAPGQLTFSGTEGYFGPADASVSYNPGAGRLPTDFVQHTKSRHSVPFNSYQPALHAKDAVGRAGGVDCYWAATNAFVHGVFGLHTSSCVHACVRLPACLLQGVSARERSGRWTSPTLMWRQHTCTTGGGGAQGAQLGICQQAAFMVSV